MYVFKMHAFRKLDFVAVIVSTTIASSLLFFFLSITFPSSRYFRFFRRIRFRHFFLLFGIFLHCRRLDRVVAWIALLHTIAYIHGGALASL